MAWRKTQGFNDDFSYPNGKFYPKQVRNDERSRIVANWVLDLPYLAGFQFSGVITLGSGTKYDIGDLSGNPSNPAPVPGGFSPPKYDFIIPNAFAFRNVDVRIRKDFPRLGRSALAVTVDVFNVFNFQNFGGFNTFNPADVNFGKANAVIGDPRRLQIGAEYTF
jgi:hypothetical protein